MRSWHAAAGCCGYVQARKAAGASCVRAAIAPVHLQTLPQRPQRPLSARNRHKSSKTSFRSALWVTVVSNVVGCTAIFSPFFWLSIDCKKAIRFLTLFACSVCHTTSGKLDRLNGLRHGATIVMIGCIAIAAIELRFARFAREHWTQANLFATQCIPRTKTQGWK